MDQNKITWEAPEFRHYEKSMGWYIAVIAVAVLLVGYFVLVERDWFAAVTMIVIVGVILYFSQHRPEMVVHELSQKGVTIGTIQFPYKHLKYFWIVEDNHHKTVNFETNTALKREIVLELGEEDAETVRQFLVPLLPEHHFTHPTIAQRASHFFKF